MSEFKDPFAGFDPDELLTMDGFDDCIIGVVECFGRSPVVCYDKDKVIDKLAEDMGHDDAVEYFFFNQLGAGMGELTPCFLNTPW
jgi:hypothetical protein|tara:strand:- start:641 stop:895 length:255 start_codon:yes stop_codon:yes gene_type:complete